MKPLIYLDSHATTRIDPRVRDVVAHHMEHTIGNPNSAEHALGEVAAQVVEDARRRVASLVNARPGEVHFTSGATESISLAIHGLIQGLLSEKDAPPYARVRVAHLAVEHHAVIDACRQAEALYPVEVVPIPVDSQAGIDMDAFHAACADGLDLLCLMAANNEVGTIYDIEGLSEVAREAGARVFSDATQAVGKIEIDFGGSALEALALSGHKFHGPKGVGALVLKTNAPFRSPFAHSDEGTIRPGTPNVPAIAGLGEACEIAASEMSADVGRMCELRNLLRTKLEREIDRLVINGVEPRLPNNLSVAIPDVPAEALIARLRDRIALSTGSACRSGVPAASHVLRAMRLPDNVQEGTVRIGLSRFTTREEIAQAGDLIAREVATMRRISEA